MKGKSKTVHPGAMEQEKKIKSRLQSLHARCNAVNKQAKEALIDVFCTDFEQMSARDRGLMEQALFAQLTSTKTMMEKTLISSRKKQLEKEYHLYLLLINELGWSEKLADEDRDILSIKHKIAGNISATSNKKSKKSDAKTQGISGSGVIANGRQTQNNQQDYNSGIVQNLQNSHIIYNGPVYMGMHSPGATSPAPAPSTPAPAPSTPAPVPSTPAPVPSTPAPVPSSPDSIPSSPDEDTSTHTPDKDLPHVGEEHPQQPSPTHPIVAPEEEEQAIDEQAPQSSTEGLSIDASLSDMKAVYEQTAMLQAEEELRADYKNTSSWNLYKRAKFFLLRGRMRKAKIAELMKGYQRLPFTQDHQVNQTLEAASTRHQLQYQFEEQSGIQSVSFIDIPEVNQLASQFVTGDIDEEHFQAAFNTFVTNDPRFQQMLALGKVDYVGTNLLQQLRFEKAQYALLEVLAEALQKGENTDQIQQKIEYFLREYQQSPFFLQEIKQDLEAGDLEKLQRYFAHQKAKRALELKNLKIKLSLLTGGKSAYQIDASDQEKGWLVKLGKKIDQLPAWAQIGGGIGIGAVAGLLGGPLGLGVVGTSVLTTGTFAGVSGFKNFIKKRTHYTKEHTTHEKNLTHSFEHQQQQIAKWQYDMTQRGAKNWRKRYRAKRQLALYQEATQHSFLKTKEVTQSLMRFAMSLRSLTSEDKNQLSWILVLVKARLDAYKQTGHNFLASDRPEEVESDMQDLYQAMQLAVNKLGIRFEEINQLQFVHNDGESYSYDAIYESLITEYEAAKKKFSSQRRSLAAKYGIGHAALSALTAGALQKFMGTGMFASEASTQTIDVSGDLQHIQHFGLGEHLLDDDNQIVSKVKDQILSLSQAGQLDVYYGAGTDATGLLANSHLADPNWYAFKMEEVIEQIELLDLTDAQKNLFIEHIQSRPWEVDWAKDFTHDYLHGGRCAEGLLHLARGLEASENTELLPQLHYDAAKSIAGELAHHNLDRNFALNLHFQDQASSIQAGTGRSWWVPIMSFANTFKKSNDGQVPEPVLLDETNHDSDDREQNSNSEESEPLQERNTSDDQTSAFSFEEAEEKEFSLDTTTKQSETVLSTFNALKKSSEAQKFLDYKGFKRVVDQNGKWKKIETQVFEPSSCVDYHGKAIYLTEVINKNHIVAYIEQKGELIPRVFRRSSSGGNWHAVPGYEASGRVSKGEFVAHISYEKGTVVKKDFNQILDNIADNNLAVDDFQIVMKTIYGKDIPKSANFHGEKEYDKMPKSAQEYYDETLVFDELLGKFNVNATWDTAFKNYHTTDQIKAYYDTLDLQQRMDFSTSTIVDTYLSYHKHLGEVENQVMTAKVKSLNPDFDGREIHVTIATAKKDGLSWVENIIFADDEGTSFLTQKNPISGGLLTTKPLEYSTQVPQFVNETPSLPEYYPYIDIRSLMQNNPLIKQRKTLHQQTGKSDKQIEIAASSADKIIDVADFSLERLDFDKYTYLMHQTDQISAKGIAEVGLQHKGALTSTTYFAGKISLPQTVEKMKAGERHRGSDSLVILAFPKDQFPITPRGTQSASDQIEEHLQLMGYPHSVPAEYVKNIIMFPS